MSTKIPTTTKLQNTIPLTEEELDEKNRLAELQANRKTASQFSKSLYLKHKQQFQFLEKRAASSSRSDNSSSSEGLSEVKVKKF